MAEETGPSNPHAHERAQFTSLLLENPNYFGTHPESGFESAAAISGNTTYEDLTCVSFNPELDLLEATVRIKLSSGYNGGLCGPGSKEWVRFYVDYGSGWEDAGVASFAAHDLPTGQDCAQHSTKPLAYAVTLPHQPKRDKCSKPILPMVRAVLSWQTMPPAGMPDWPQVWGNTVDSHVQVKPRKPVLIDIAESVAVALGQKKVVLPAALEASKNLPIPLPDPPDPTLAGLAALYGAQGAEAKAKAPATAVAAHRFGMADVKAAQAPGLFNEQVAAVKASQWASLGLDWPSAVAALDKTKGDVTYEELDCVALDYNREWLVASFRIKRATGFSGGPCDKGSFEYIAFWVDYEDTCEWTYLGTAKLGVHDYSDIPADGLHYWVGLPAQLGAHRTSCKTPKVGRVRAVLSWNAEPSTTNPDSVPHWGNRRDVHIEIKPGTPQSNEASIDVLGGISVSQIDVAGGGMTVPNAVFAEWGSPADPYGPSRTCPFGGRVNVQADVPEAFSALGRKYRLIYRQVGTTDEFPVKTKFLTTSGISLPVWRTPSNDGWVDYLPPSQNVFNMLGWWETGSLGDDLWEIRLEMATSAYVVIGTTGWHRIQLDNTAPEAEVHIDSGGDCKDFDEGVPVEGKFLARDEHFGHYSLYTLPASLSPPNPTPVPPLPISSETLVAPGSHWKLETGGMVPCGYVIVVEVWDRTIVGSNINSHNYGRDDVGFCLRQMPV